MLDTLIKGAQVIDGTGAPAFRADVGIKDGKLVLIYNDEPVSAHTVIDAAGYCVCPGFIDAHSHGDLVVGRSYAQLCKTSQGITTEVAGQCGNTNFPTSQDPVMYQAQLEFSPILAKLGPEVTESFAKYRAYLERTPKTAHIKQFVGHRALRQAVMGNANRTATAKELENMKALLREGMENGAAGLTTGLVYPPSGFADQHEITELCKVIEPFHGIYTTHMRDEGDEVIASVKESIETARDAGVRLSISHHKVSGVQNWGRSKETLALIDEAVAAGQEVAFDVYPYTASMTSLFVCLPLDEFQYSQDERIARLKDRATRAKIAKTMAETSGKYSQLKSFDDVLLVSCSKTPQYNAVTVADVAKERGVAPFDAYFDMLIENEFQVMAVFFSMCEDDLCRIFMHERAMVGTDGLVYSHSKPTHPRGFGTFPRAINYFVREKKLLSLEAAIRKMTSFTADWLMLKNKGRIQDGYDADLLIFDPNIIAEGNSYADSTKPAIGISHVFVDGQLVCQNSELTGVCPGRLILHN